MIYHWAVALLVKQKEHFIITEIIKSNQTKKIENSIKKSV